MGLFLRACPCFPAARSRSSSATSKAPRGCCRSSETNTRRSWATTAGSCAARWRATAEPRSTPRATRSSSRSRARRMRPTPRWRHSARRRPRMAGRRTGAGADGTAPGEPQLGEHGYVGIDVVRAARICSAGRGGQILLSETTRALLGNALPTGACVLDLGQQNLKDIQHERIFQLSLDEQPREERPLKTNGGVLESSFEPRITDFVERQLEEGEKQGRGRRAPQGARAGADGGAGRRLQFAAQTYGGDQVSTWSVLRQSCKSRSPVGLVKQPGKRKCGERSRTRCLVTR